MGKYDERKKTFDEEIELMIRSSKEERPTALRSNIVEKYVREILSNKQNPKLYQ